MTALRATDLVVGYGAEAVLNQLTLEVPAGQVVGLLGPNGAGKSTLLKALSGLLRLRSGSIRLGDTDVSRHKVERRARAGLVLVPEGRRLFKGLTVVENLRVGRLIGRDGMRPEDVLDLFPRLAERRTSLAAQLSGGEQQMLAIGRALCAKPDVLLVDEPSLGLAPKITESVFATFAELARGGLTVCIGEQNVAAAVQVTDRCFVLDRGQVVLDSPTTDEASRRHVMSAYSQMIALSE